MFVVTVGCVLMWEGGGAGGGGAGRGELQTEVGSAGSLGHPEVRRPA